jgi:hypothetical protein
LLGAINYAKNNKMIKNICAVLLARKKVSAGLVADLEKDINTASLVFDEEIEVE